MATYTCKYCGAQNANSMPLTGNFCAKSPTKYHQLMNATEKLPKYTCAYCGYQAPNPSALTSNFCSKSPSKYHELLG